MSDSLLDDIIRFEDEVNIKIAAGKRQIRAQMEMRQAELEARYAALLERLNKHHADKHRQQRSHAVQIHEDQMRRCEMKITRETAISEQQIVRCLKELFNSELWGDQDDHQNVQS